VPITLNISGLALPSYADIDDKLLEIDDEYNFIIEVIYVEKVTQEEIKENLEFQSREIVTPQGLSRPKEVWNVATKGGCHFSGKAERSILYSEYVFTGKDEYTYYIENIHDKELTIKIKKDNLLGSTIATIKVPGNTAKTYKITTGEDFYFMYYAPVDAFGYLDKIARIIICKGYVI